jgi:hypothetical protein
MRLNKVVSNLRQRSVPVMESETRTTNDISKNSKRVNLEKYNLDGEYRTFSELLGKLINGN